MEIGKKMSPVGEITERETAVYDGVISDTLMQLTEKPVQFDDVQLEVLY